MISVRIDAALIQFRLKYNGKHSSVATAETRQAATILVLGETMWAKLAMFPKCQIRYVW